MCVHRSAECGPPAPPLPPDSCPSVNGRHPVSISTMRARPHGSHEDSELALPSGTERQASRLAGTCPCPDWRPRCLQEPQGGLSLLWDSPEAGDAPLGLTNEQVFSREQRREGKQRMVRGKGLGGAACWGSSDCRCTNLGPWKERQKQATGWRSVKRRQYNLGRLPGGGSVGALVR